MRDLKNLGRGVPTLKSQVLLAVCAFGAGVLVNQHFTDKYIERANAARRAALMQSTQPCITLTYAEEIQ